MRWLAVTIALAGCNRIFDLQETTLQTPDASVCWDPTQTSHDEDGDTIVDGCDICPNIPNTDQADEDHDGVGDVCDVHLGDPRDHLVFFDAFASDLLDPRWLAFGSSSSWAIGNDQVKQTMASGTGTLIFHQVFTNPTFVAVERDQIQVDPTLFSSLGVYTRIDAAAEKTYPEALACFSYFQPSTQTARRALIAETEPTQIPKKDTTIPFGDPLTLIGTSTGACNGRVGDGAATLSEVTLPPFDGEIALLTHYTSGTFDSIAVYESAP